MNYGDPILEPELRRTERQPTLAIRGATTLAELPRTIGEFLGEVHRRVVALGERAVGQPYTRYHDARGERIELEAGLPVARDLSGEGRVRPSELPAAESAVLSHLGPYETLVESGSRLGAWALSQGRVACGPNWEVYVTDPGAEKDPTKWRTDIYMPLHD